VNIVVGKDYYPVAQDVGDMIRDGLVILTLQTDAIMLCSEDVRKLSAGEDLKNLYVAFWTELSGGKDDTAHASLELLDFYAHQTFKGGYVYHRHLGAREKHINPQNYYPYYLTCAGSVFKLKPRDEAKARACLEKWLHSGLDLPEWAKDKYARTDTWKSCPFVSQNGFGEIVVNLNWHWDHRI
jgi:hypothetical protein